jgi:hypothetical protein
MGPGRSREVREARNNRFSLAKKTVFVFRTRLARNHAATALFLVVCDVIAVKWWSSFHRDVSRRRTL